jgi:hypothetical protein
MPDRVSRSLRRCGVVTLVIFASVASGCGSASVAELPPPAAPRDAPPLNAPPAGRVVPLGSNGLRAPAAAERISVDDGAKFAVVRRRERVLELFDAETKARLARADAGVGPAAGVANDRWLWVTDTRGDALLVFRTRPELELVRRVFLPGGPYAIALDEERLRLWVTLTGTNEIAELPAHGRPSELRRLGTVRQPKAVAVDSRTHRVRVGGEDRLQVFDPPPLEAG